MSCIAYPPLFAQCAPMLAKQIGANIRAARKAFPTPDKKGLSQERLAARIRPSTTYQTIQKLERAEVPISIQWLERIAAALDIDPMELIAPNQALQRAAFNLSEQVAIEAAQTLAAVALQGEEPEPGIVQAVALILRELTLTFSDSPEAAVDPVVARPAIRQLARRFSPAAS